MEIKDARIAAGMTQQEMSDKLGIPKRTIENWEGGVTKPPEYVKNLVLRELERLKK
jgi:DNA-binding transcriptional regulator YiaG